jgi:uncharacterized membrane protein YgdD (TMEM256/DUF423 family)
MVEHFSLTEASKSAAMELPKEGLPIKIVSGATVAAAVLAAYFYAVFFFSSHHQGLYAQEALAAALTSVAFFLTLSLGRIFSSTELVKRFWPLIRIVLPLCVALLTFLATKISAQRIPATQDFVEFRERLFFICCAFAVILAVMVVLTHRARKRLIKVRFPLSDICLFLFPAFPLVNYVAANIDYFNLPLMVRFAAIFLVIPAFAGVIGAMIFKPRVSANIVLICVAACSFAMNSMPMITSLMGSDLPQFKYHAALLAASFVLISLGYRLFRGPLYAFFFGLVGAASFMSIPHAPLYVKHPDNMPKDLDPSIYLERQPEQKPDIYLLVYDSYLPDKVLRFHGIDNSDQNKFLEERGFKIYPDVYTVAVRTQPSMSRVLSMRPKPLNPIGGPNTTFRAIESWGYFSHMLGNGHLLAGVNALRIGPDVVAPANMESSGVDAIAAAIKNGYFRHNQFLGTTPLQYNEWVNEKRSMMRRGFESKDPYFMYAHSLAAHIDYRDGACKGNEVAKYKEDLGKANQEMRDDIDLILSSNRKAIVVIAGDHGPGALTCEALERGLLPENNITGARLADVYGTFVAIKWPDENYHEYDDIRILQDVQFAVFSYILRNKSVFSIRLPQEIVSNNNVNSAVKDGVIMIGPDKGKKLFESF